ncbi:hypothetical protein J1N35_039041 [Gossypium stocksii]|uniref:RNase H type-1 domain-containing protein n=1 Tax=Gossypium stocksii TaxID=47602 RepID=A0A9D3ZND8_9ROSI|nr:hypothetical protein J1N35_039041 [Gossypium stocksii]
MLSSKYAPTLMITSPLLSASDGDPLTTNYDVKYRSIVEGVAELTINESNVKINVDAAFNVKDSDAGLGTITRNGDAMVLGGQACSKTEVLNITCTKARTITIDLELAHNTKLRNIVLEFDNIVEISKLKHVALDLSLSYPFYDLYLGFVVGFFNNVISKG